MSWWRAVGLFVLALLVLAAVMVWFAYRLADSITEVLTFGG